MDTVFGNFDELDDFDQFIAERIARAGPQPLKKDPSEALKRKAFDEKKDKLASDFLAKLDMELNQGQIGEMTKGTGGIKIKWNKSLIKTAGRARCWGRKAYDTIEDRQATIELSEKVIDDEGE